MDATRIVVRGATPVGDAPVTQRESRVRIEGVPATFEGQWQAPAADGSRVCAGTVQVDEARHRFTCVPDPKGAAAPRHAQDAAPAPTPAARVPDTGANFAAMSPPTYPKGESLKGRVIMEVEVRADGQVAAAKVARSSGHAVLDDGAREAVLKWRFNPAYSAGVAVASRIRVPIDFGPNRESAGEDPDALEGLQVNR